MHVCVAMDITIIHVFARVKVPPCLHVPFSFMTDSTIVCTNSSPQSKVQLTHPTVKIPVLCVVGGN